MALQGRGIEMETQPFGAPKRVQPVASSGGGGGSKPPIAILSLAALIALVGCVGAFIYWQKANTVRQEIASVDKAYKACKQCFSADECRQLRRNKGQDPDAPLVAGESDKPKAPKATQQSDRGPKLESSSDPRLKKGVRPGKMTIVSVTNVTSNEKIQMVSMNDVLAPKTVTIVNLWATWCVPCKKEMGEFKKILAHNNWGNKVRFIPVLADNVDAGSTYRKFRKGEYGDAPPSRAFLVDHASRIQETLRKKGMY